jgi:hypothetical protein
MTFVCNECRTIIDLVRDQHYRCWYEDGTIFSNILIITMMMMMMM